MQTLGVSVKQLRRKLFELGARILHAQGSKPRDMALVMLSMGSALDVRRGGREGEVGGRGGGRRDGGSGETTTGTTLARGVRIATATVRGHSYVLQQEAMVAAARDRAIRTGSVRQDLALNLPPRLELPDGEERPYGAQTNIHLRDPLQESEIYQKCIRPPPNRTIFDSESPPPYRSQSGPLEPPEQRASSSGGYGGNDGGGGGGGSGCGDCSGSFSFQQQRHRPSSTITATAAAAAAAAAAVAITTTTTTKKTTTITTMTRFSITLSSRYATLRLNYDQ
ncbi:hypothetical protein M0804_014344 [Polistes exclamans]|nr:hypothetical protein M0804_014344 [Polistes exclamans]